jgi:hypothetical protein
MPPAGNRPDLPGIKVPEALGQFGEWPCKPAPGWELPKEAGGNAIEDCFPPTTSHNCRAAGDSATVPHRRSMTGKEAECKCRRGLRVAASLRSSQAVASGRRCFTARPPVQPLRPAWTRGLPLEPAHQDIVGFAAEVRKAAARAAETPEIPRASRVVGRIRQAEIRRIERVIDIPA